MTSLVREVLKEGAKLGLTRVERLVFILVAAFVIVLAKVAGKKLEAAIVRGLKNMTPPTAYDEHGRDANAPIAEGEPADPDPDATDPTRGSG